MAGPTRTPRSPLKSSCIRSRGHGTAFDDGWVVSSSHTNICAVAPSAGGSWPWRRPGDAAGRKREVTITSVEPVGSYAIAEPVTANDSACIHGIISTSWASVSRNGGKVHLDRLQAAGASREPSEAPPAPVQGGCGHHRH